MDQKQLEEKIKEYFLRLPPELQEVVGSGKWIDAVAGIGKTNGLNVPQMGQLQNEVMLVLLGIIHPDKFLWDIKDSIGLPTDKIEKLIKETSEQVFVPIREKLMGVYIKNTTDDAPETPAETAQEKSILNQAGISLQDEKTPDATRPTENRTDLLKGIENPVKSQPAVLNESKLPTSGGINTLKSTVRDMAVPVAPYAKEPSPAAPVAPTQTETSATASTAASAPAPTDIMAGKLGGTFTVPKKDTDYSIKNLGGLPPPSTQLGKDAYREPIE